MFYLKSWVLVLDFGNLDFDSFLDWCDTCTLIFSCKLLVHVIDQFSFFGGNFFLNKHVKMTPNDLSLPWPQVFCLILSLKLFADWVPMYDLDFSRYFHSVLKFPPFWIYNLCGIWCCFAFEFPKKHFKSVVLSDWLVMTSNQDKIKKDAFHIVTWSFLNISNIFASETSNLLFCSIRIWTLNGFHTGTAKF